MRYAGAKSQYHPFVSTLLEPTCGWSLNDDQIRNCLHSQLRTDEIEGIVTAMGHARRDYDQARLPHCFAKPHAICELPLLIGYESKRQLETAALDVVGPFW